MTAPGNGPIDELRRYAAALKAEVRHAAGPSAGLALATKPSVSRRRRLAAVAGGVAVFLVANLGLAWASDSAVPGNVMYPIDRAYERAAAVVGLSPDVVAERFDEAAQLLASGEEDLALEAAAAGMTAASGDPQLASAARQFAALRAELHGEADDRFADQVAELVDAAHEVADVARAGDVPRYAAHEVSVHAREVAAEVRDDNPRQGNGPPDDNPGNGNAPPNDNPSNGNAPPNDNPSNGNAPPDDNPGQDKDKDKDGKP